MLGINNIHLNHEEPESENGEPSGCPCFFDTCKEIKEAAFHGFCRTIGVNNLCAARIRFTLDRDKRDRFEVNQNMVLLCFMMEGEMEASTPNVMPVKMAKGLHNICYMPSVSGDLLCPCGRHDAFYVGMPLALFKTYLPDIPSPCNDFHRKASQGDFVLLRPKHAHITHKIYRIIDDICHYKSDKQFQNLYIKAKIIELVSAQLEQLCTSFCGYAPLNKETVDKMYIVRDFIETHLDEYHSLKTLAKKAGTNEHTLKKEFKELFGETVFGFWSDAKMGKAQNMLLDRTKSIKQVSEAVGYKNPQHFSTAFKKKFKMSPSAFRKNNNQNK